MNTLRVAREEARRHASRLDRRALLVFAVLGLLFGGLFALAPDLRPDPEEDLYLVEAHPESALRPAAENATRLRVVVGDGQRFVDGGADLYLQDHEVLHHDHERSRSAVEALEQAVRLWLDRELAGEADQDAAFPLEITLAYEGRRADPDERLPPEGPTEGPSGPDEGPGEGPDGDPDDSTPDLLDDVEPAGEVRAGLRPGQVEPPFPIRSLLLTFAYLLPASLLAQVHAANLHAERTRRRGVMLLSAPLRPGQVLLGKSLPALTGALLIGVAITVVLGAGLVGFLASLSFLGFLFAATTLLALLARSPRELTLQQVAMTTLLNTFLFLPAMFPALPPVAFLSPIHVVAASIRGEAVSLGPFLYATLPLGLAALALAVLAIGFLRDEVLFAVGSSVPRVLQAAEEVTRGRLRVLAAGALVVPFVFAAELVVLVISAVMGLGVAFLLFLPLSVLLEEVAKGFPLWARARRPDRAGPPWLLGVLVGTGFFLAEKGALVLTLVGFRELPFGPEALALLGTGPGIALLMLPLAVHVGTAVLLALGAFRGRRAAWAAFLLAAAFHFAYDQIVLEVAFR